ncbi:MAG: AMP-binding protein, partial [bacterium]|nr:AMP-binding protein [bacterium]
GLLAPLSAGGSVVATEGFDAFRFFGQLRDLRPTYYTAVPTMHQMVLARSARYAREARSARLRFVRSSSASLPGPVLEELRDLFGVPVIESYGMTEATHQMCANPLPPGEAKTRSVGLPAGIELAILDEAGRTQPPGTRGEVSIKGPTVIDGYENNPTADEAAFTDGWFRTGDEGYLDGDGYLFLTGRLKEQINRGGEKISPLEVDEVLLRHEAVAQAVTFAMPHDKLGEQVAAAVVLADDATATETELRHHVGRSLAAFKVPRRVVFCDELPKGPTGKLQRIGLAQRLGLAEPTAPRAESLPGEADG